MIFVFFHSVWYLFYRWWRPFTYTHLNQITYRSLNSPYYWIFNCLLHTTSRITRVKKRTHKFLSEEKLYDDLHHQQQQKHQQQQRQQKLQLWMRLECFIKTKLKENRSIVKIPISDLFLSFVCFFSVPKSVLNNIKIPSLFFDAQKLNDNILTIEYTLNIKSVMWLVLVAC